MAKFKISRRAVKAAAQIAAITCAFAAGAVALTPVGAQAASPDAYSGTDAANYAIKYTCNENASCRNPFYKANDDDCANLVSQALASGGLNQDNTWYYYSTGQGTGKISDAWGKASTLFVWLNQSKGYTLHDLTKYYGQRGNVGAPTGSIIQYDWGGGESWSHVALVTGTGTYANYSNYRTVTESSTGTRITQHVTDRDGAPWDLGYYLNDHTWRTKARARYIMPGYQQ